MQQLGEASAAGAERKRVEAVVETLATLQSQGETLAAVAHDARNMVTALGLYCDLLEEPGVLAAPYAHYGSELRLVAAASRRLIAKLMAIENPAAAQPSFWRNDASPSRLRHGTGQCPASGQQTVQLPDGHGERWDGAGSVPMADFAAELTAARNLLSALAGPAIVVTLEARGGARPVRLSAEDLTRVLVNLVKNAVEAMPGGGRIEVRLREEEANAGVRLILTVEDNGPGIASEALEKVFESGYSGHAQKVPAETNRGLGLAISRGIIEAAGGRMHAENRALGGARMVIELPAGK